MLKRLPATGDVVRQELRVCLEAASRYQRNYYAWSHRMWVVANLTPDATANAIDSELQVLSSWIPAHVSEFGAFHYRQVLLLRMQSLGHLMSQPLQQELHLLETLLGTFRDRESLFLHRRFVLFMLAQEDGGRDWATGERLFIQRQRSLAGYNGWHHLLIDRHGQWLQLFFPKTSESL